MSDSPPNAGAPRQSLVVTGDDGRRYRIVEKLGQGGFGDVYRAWAEDRAGVARQVAIKILKDSVPEEVEIRFRDEVRMLGLVKHRAIVELQGVVRMDGRPCAVLEFVPGVDLKAVIEHEPPPPRVAVRIVEEVASALHAAYAQVHESTGLPLRLVHRDIKPANIRVTPDGEVRVVDFGGARAEFAAREARTRSFVVGSYRYMAPERLDQIDTPRSDVYSLGLVLAEMLAGDAIPTPSKHFGQHEDFVEAVREAVLGRLAGGGVGDASAQRVFALLEGMLDYYPERRPSAREVELHARTLLLDLPGPTLREWAEQAVARIERSLRRDATPLAWGRVAAPPPTAPATASSLEVTPLARGRERRAAQPAAPAASSHEVTPLASRRERRAAPPPPSRPAPAARPRSPEVPMRPDRSDRPVDRSAVPLVPALALVLLAGVLSSVMVHQLRGMERGEPPVREFRPVAPLPIPVTEWAPLEPPAPPPRASVPAPPRPFEEAEPAERPKRGLFRFLRRKQR